MHNVPINECPWRGVIQAYQRLAPGLLKWSNVGALTIAVLTKVGMFAAALTLLCPRIPGWGIPPWYAGIATMVQSNIYAYMFWNGGCLWRELIPDLIKG